MPAHGTFTIQWKLSLTRSVGLRFFFFFLSDILLYQYSITIQNKGNSFIGPEKLVCYIITVAPRYKEDGYIKTLL